MPKARSTQISLEATPYYHCVSRCVRRAFLCGTDAITGQSYEHRRQWIEDKILELADAFAIDICAYAVMSNHYHIVLHINQAVAQGWTTDDVIRQWHKQYAGYGLSQRYLAGEPLSLPEYQALSERVESWRERLMSVSWFMGRLNESIARDANEEDECTGRFWEGRFKSQALLDEAALMACMAYVDLNPIRAKMANTPEASEHTSIKRRINTNTENSSQLFPFVGNQRRDMPQGLPFNLDDYIEVVDWTGRVIRDDKRGYIKSNLPPILERLQQDPENWLYLTQNFESKFKRLVGAANKVKSACQKLSYKRTINLQNYITHFT